MRVCAACELRFRACVDRDAYVEACDAETAPIERSGDANEASSASSACSVCLGILQIAVSRAPRASNERARDERPKTILDIASIDAFATRAVARGHRPGSFKLNVILPAAVLARERATLLSRAIDPATTRVTPIDDALRIIVAPTLTEALGCEENANGAEYALTAKYKYGDDQRETEFLSAVKLQLSAKEREARHKRGKKGWDKQRWQGKRKRGGGGGKKDDFLAKLSSPEDPFADEFETATRAYEDAARRLADARFNESDAFMEAFELTAPRYRVRCVLEAFHAPVHVGGWYVKLDRGVPQSQWISRETGARIGRGSVVEAIERVVLKGLGSNGAKFNSSGREDMDVRMLSDGRPFALQVHDPKTPLASAENVAAMEREINAQSDITGVRVRGLCFTTKENYHAVGMSSEEHEKEKSYVAIVRVSREATPEDHEKIASTSRLVVQQSTPTRVAHRRADLVRPRTIVSMSSEPIPGSPDSFILRLRTQAGTYVKEFVHGDAGRTAPSLGDLLGCRAEIIQLDVTAINDDWNPSGAPRVA